MSVMVVARRQAAPGQAVALVAAAHGQVAAGAVPGRQWTRVFRGVEDADAVLCVAEWESHEAYERAGAEGARGAELDALAAGEAERWFFTVRRSYGLMQRRAAAALCALIQVPRGAGEGTRVLWGEAGEALRSTAGFVQGFACEDEDDSDHFLTMSEWESAEAARAFLDRPGSLMRPQLAELDAEVVVFEGVAREGA